MRILGVIPARFASTRFPGKPLVDIKGKSMIMRVYEQAKKASSLSKVVIATDDKRILDHVLAAGGEAIITSDKHQSGTDRCAEIAKRFDDFDVIINIQGDEPFIDPEQIDSLAACFLDTDYGLATLVKRITSTQELFNNNTPKVVINSLSEAIYFSRSTIPFLRNIEPENWLDQHVFYKHIGIYGYRLSALQEITKLPISILEKTEALEQLRWIENGYKIKVAITDKESIAIDTPDDLKKAIEYIS
ncbi:MAG: 3-deoxy-manno-octulosonate cytidylyltransferase [Sphingobacteriales bacterium]|nr:3-deoxy-manno-octulosonate cytidylyltransferase [Sphingobacteriales bacterium]